MFDSLRENFELILVILFLISMLAYFAYRSTFYRQIKADLVANRDRLAATDRKERKRLRANISAHHINSPIRKVIFFFADLFWVLLFVVVIRSFLFEPFIIPSGSMKPGLQVGDIVLVNKFEKGLRLPVSNNRLTQGSPIERGDVLVFKYPKDITKSYIKRVIGLPNDKISYDGRNLMINGQAISVTPISTLQDSQSVWDSRAQSAVERTIDFEVKEEDLLGKKHTLQYATLLNNRLSPREWIVPKGKYLMFGDNRDNSSDGRVFGYLDDSLIIGRAKRIAFNFDCLKGNGKCNRFFKSIQ